MTQQKPAEPDPTDLHEPVDWMTYTHEQLYKMVTTGVDLGSAHTVKDGWTDLSTVLADVSKKLKDAILLSDQGWEGESAEQAREGLLSITDWAGHTSEHAQNVATCIDAEIKNVDDVRTKMPPPPNSVPAPVPVPPKPAFTREASFMDEAAAMVGHTTPFYGMETVATPAVNTVVASDALHRQAADVMAAFQRSSIAVDQTVPQLAPPTNPVGSGTGGGGPVVTSTPPPEGSGSGAGGPVVATGTGGQNTTRASSRGGMAGFGRVPMGGGGGGSHARTFMPPAAAAGGGGAGGGASGVLGSEPARGAAAAAAAAQGGGQTKAFQNPLQMGAAPMAAAPAAANRSEDEREYKHAAYLEEDDNLFGLDRKAAPPVIGQ